MEHKRHNHQSNENLRQSNIELLRIIAMFLIVGHHLAVHSGFVFSADTISVNQLWIQFIQIGGKISVNIFVLISGYFLITSKAFKVNKILKLWGQIFFYSITIFFVFIILGIEPFTIKGLIKHIAPITFSQWWFASTYFMLYLISPYLNILLRSFDKVDYLKFLLLLGLCWSIIPTITGSSFQSNNLLWFIFLYSLAGYIRIFGLNTKCSGLKYILLAVIVTTATFLSAVVFDFLGTKNDFFALHATYFYGMQKLPVLVISLLMFIGFSKINITNNNLINVISSSTFGVYLIHECDYVRTFLWKTKFNVAAYVDSSNLIIYTLCVIVAVFIGCTIIELARLYLLEKRYMPVLDKFSEFIEKLIDVIFLKLKLKF